jgi:hypothetical protein
MVADIKYRPAKPNHRKDNVRAWAPAIGLRAAARKFGVKENTALAWAHREHWILPDVFKPIQKRCNQAAISAHEAQQSVIAEQGEESRLYLAAAGLKASYEAAQRDGASLLDKNASIAVLNHARSLDTVHGWTASRTNGSVSVQIANVIQPTPEEKAERQAMFTKLEEITRRLAAPEA